MSVHLTFPREHYGSIASASIKWRCRQLTFILRILSDAYLTNAVNLASLKDRAKTLQELKSNANCRIEISMKFFTADEFVLLAMTPKQ